ncbi:MAG: hypothetical protein IJW09_05580 [Clostridia bacterium]|nr:hypothetical protein [Clostridia bacterium]
MQAGYRFLLYSVPRYKLLHEKNIKVYSASLAALPSRAAGGGRKSFFFLGRGWRLDSPFWRQAQKKIVFVNRLVELGVRSSWQKLLLLRLRASSCLQVSLTCKRKS